MTPTLRIPKGRCKDERIVAPRVSFDRTHAIVYNLCR